VPLLGTSPPVAPGWWEALPRAAVTEGIDELDALARALAEAVRTRYGSRLGEADLDTVTRQIRNALERAQQMRKVELANGDEPDFVFSAPGEPAT
jgi:hypothetical protein